jgi:hypothetical protein
MSATMVRILNISVLPSLCKTRMAELGQVNKRKATNIVNLDDIG